MLITINALLIVGCKNRPVVVTTPITHSTGPIDTVSHKGNFVFAGDELYYFRGGKADTTVLLTIRDTVMLDSVMREVKEDDLPVVLYGDEKAGYPKFKMLINAFKKQEIFNFSMVTMTDSAWKNLKVH